MLRFHSQTAGSSLTAQRPENNLVRVALQCLAAVLGGCQSLHANGMDEALALPPSKPRCSLCARSKIIAQETGVTNTIDPVAGSYAIEKLTDEIEAHAREYIAKIDAMGGMLKAIEAGYVQQEVQKARLRISTGRRHRRASGRRRRESLSRPRKSARFRSCASIQKLSGHRWRVCRRCVLGEMRRQQQLRRRAEIERRAGSGENLMPAILSAVEAYVTVGEISDALRRAFGEYQESVVI